MTNDEKAALYDQLLPKLQELVEARGKIRKDMDIKKLTNYAKEAYVAIFIVSTINITDDMADMIKCTSS